MSQFVFIGTYTASYPQREHRKEGIYTFRWDPLRDSLELCATADNVQNPSFLALHPNGQFFFAVNELGQGRVSAFKVDPSTGSLHFLNSQPTDGSAPCYLSFDPTGKWVLVSNYGNGTVAVFPIHPDGSLGPHSDHIQHQGQGADRTRQERAHAHSIRFDPSGQYVLAADLGLDEVIVYRFDSEHGKLLANDPAFGTLTSGAGPRHLAYHPSGKVLYVANELNNTVTACTWDAARGAITPYQSLSTLPAGFQGESAVADIHLDGTGKFLYVSNRGHHSLAVYQVAADGHLTASGHVSSGGEWPRNFAVLPKGERLLVANERSSNLVLFEIGASGMPQPTGLVLPVPQPVCVLPAVFE